MKNHIILGVMLLSSLFFFSCDNNSMEPLPDLTLKAEITGALTRSIDFTLPMGTADTRIANGSYSSALNSLTINGMDSQKWNMSMIFQATGVETGTFQFNQGQIDLMAFTDQEAGRGFVSTSGSVTITKADLFQDVGSSIGAADDYYIDGTFNATLVENGSNPPATINISGSFKGMNIKAN